MAKFESAFTKKLKALLQSDTSAKVVLTMLRDTRVSPLVALNQVYTYLCSLFHRVPDIPPEEYAFLASFQGLEYASEQKSYSVRAYSAHGTLFNLPHLAFLQTADDTMEGFNNKGVVYIDRADSSDPSIVYVVPENKYYIKAPTLFFP